MAVPVIGTQSIAAQAASNSSLAPVNAPSFSLASLSSPSGGSPNQVIDDATTNSSTSTMSYPADTPFYYMSLGIATYSRASWASVGTLTANAVIILPLPEQLVDVQSEMFEQVNIGLTGEAAIAATSALRGTGNIPNAQEIAKAGVNGAASVIAQAFQTPAAAALASAGIAVNDFLTVMFKGPAYKRREFTWRFSPRNSGESTTLMNIVNTIKNAQAPGLSGAASAFWNWPNVFQIQFRTATGVDMSSRLYAFKTCVLENAIFNYTPAGVPVFHGGTQQPEGLQMTLSFLELELWTTGQFGEGTSTSTSPGTTQVGAASNITLDQVQQAVAGSDFPLSGALP